MFFFLVRLFHEPKCGLAWKMVMVKFLSQNGNRQRQINNFKLYLTKLVTVIAWLKTFFCKVWCKNVSSFHEAKCGLKAIVHAWSSLAPRLEIHMELYSCSWLTSLYSLPEWKASFSFLKLWCWENVSNFWSNQNPDLPQDAALKSD